MKNYKIAPATYKIALRVVTWNHTIWNRYGYDDAPDAFAQSIIDDAAEIGLPVCYSAKIGLHPNYRTPGKGSLELSDAIDFIKQNHRAHATPLSDRYRYKNWLKDMYWYNVRRYSERTTGTCAQDCAYYLRHLRMGKTHTSRLCELAQGLTYTLNERKRELDARMNDSKNAIRPLCWAKELPF